MRHRFLWLGCAAALAALAFFMEGSVAQPGRKGPFGKKGGARQVTADQITERIMSFDKNNDGKITLDELPERMQHLIALGDVNKDGVLDRAESSKLAATLESFAGLTGGGIPGGGLPGGAGPGGKGKGGPPKGALKGPAAEVQRTLDDLNVTGPARDKADRALRAHQDKMRQFEELWLSELFSQMKDTLNEEDYRSLKSALDRPPFKGPRPDVSSRIDQIQKELDDLRRKLPK